MFSFYDWQHKCTYLRLFSSRVVTMSEWKKALGALGVLLSRRELSNLVSWWTIELLTAFLYFVARKKKKFSNAVETLWMFTLWNEIISMQFLCLQVRTIERNGGADLWSPWRCGGGAGDACTAVCVILRGRCDDLRRCRWHYTRSQHQVSLVLDFLFESRSNSFLLLETHAYVEKIRYFFGVFGARALALCSKSMGSTACKFSSGW